MLRRRAPARAKVAAQRWPEVADAQTQPSPLTAFTSVSSRLTTKTNLNPVFAQKALSALEALGSRGLRRCSPAQLTSLFGSRKLRLAPRIGLRL